MRVAAASGSTAREPHLLLLVFDLELALGPEALDREILELTTIGRIWNRVYAVRLEPAFLLLGRRRNRKPHEHRARIVGYVGRQCRMTAPVLQMAVLASTRVEQRAKPVGGVR